VPIRELSSNRLSRPTTSRRVRDLAPGADRRVRESHEIVASS
jgi:hypothetical protein